MSRLGELWHVGIVVDDLDAAMRDFAQTPGLRFTSTLDREVSVQTGCGVQTGRVRWAATQGEQPPWEVIEQTEGFWSRERNGGAALHHLAYWSDDLDADVADYQAAGYRLEAKGHDEDGLVRFVYLVSSCGVRIELGARYTKQSWDEWVGGGDYALQF